MSDTDAPSPVTSSQTAPQVPLSDREIQVLELVAAGLTNQEIAEQLDISKRTVDNHISNILTKTETDNRVALVRWALQWGKVCLDDVNCCSLPPYPPTAQDSAAP
ncbi:MAG: response regulator transcription factor [Synechococcales bacterium]|nr:response regulator transcription factor [Synechococcales bacterium]